MNPENLPDLRKKIVDYVAIGDVMETIPLYELVSMIKSYFSQKFNSNMIKDIEELMIELSEVNPEFFWNRCYPAVRKKILKNYPEDFINQIENLLIEMRKSPRKDDIRLKDKTDLYKNLNNIYNFELLKCVKCESFKTSRLPFQYRKRIGYEIGPEGKYFRVAEKFIFIDVPVCSLCRDAMNNWMKLSVFSQPFYFLSVIIFIISICLGWGTGNISFFIIGVVWLTFSIYWYARVKTRGSNPNKYLYYDTRDGRLYVKPKNTTKWILYQNWAQRALIERNNFRNY